MSVLDALTREELESLVIKLHGRLERLQAEIAELTETAECESERIRELEEENARLRSGGSSAGLCVRPSVTQAADRG